VLQRVAVCCSLLKRVAACCSVLQRVVACCSVLQCVAVCCSVLQCQTMKLWYMCTEVADLQKDQSNINEVLVRHVTDASA